jgi:hypothetical protein
MPKRRSRARQRQGPPRLPIPVRTETDVDYPEAYEVIRSHLPEHRRWWRILLARPRCARCRRRWPCQTHRDALDTIVPERPVRRGGIGPYLRDPDVV